MIELVLLLGTHAFYEHLFSTQRTVQGPGPSTGTVVVQRSLKVEYTLEY